MVSRRAMIAGGAGALAVAGLGYRAWDRGVFAGPNGPAYAPWAQWRGSVVDGIARPLSAAILAANPHDTQPWLFEPRDEAVTIYADRARNLGTFDPFRREMHLGIGAATENLVRAAGVYGYSAYVRPVEGRLTPSPPDVPKAAVHVTLDPGAPARDPLYEAIPSRHTHRGVYLDRKVDPALLRQITALIADLGVTIAFVQDAKARADLAGVIVGATERIVGDPAMSGDSARWIRTGRREVEAHRDGVTVDTAGLSPATVVFGKMLPDLSAADQDRYWLANTRDVQTHAPVLGMILVKDRLDMVEAIAAGRAWQRLHLLATALGLVAQPLNQPVECVDRNAMLGRPDSFRRALMSLAMSPNREATFVFRLGYAEGPTAPSPRRPLQDVIRSSGYA